MVVLLRNTGDVDSIDVQYQTFAGNDYDNLQLTYEWFISPDFNEESSYHHLIVKSKGNYGASFFGDAGIAQGIEESTRKLYARAWLDCMDLDSNNFRDETGNRNKFQVDSFSEILTKYQMRDFCRESPFYRELTQIHP